MCLSRYNRERVQEAKGVRIIANSFLNFLDLLFAGSRSWLKRKRATFLFSPHLITGLRWNITKRYNRYDIIIHIILYDIILRFAITNYETNLLSSKPKLLLVRMVRMICTIECHLIMLVHHVGPSCWSNMLVQHIGRRRCFQFGYRLSTVFMVSTPGLHQYCWYTTNSSQYGNWERAGFRYGYKLSFVGVQNIPAF